MDQSNADNGNLTPEQAAELKRTADGPHQGEMFVLKYTDSQQERIASEKVRELLSPKDLKKVLNVLDIRSAGTTRISGKKKDFAAPNMGNATLSGLIDQLGACREDIKDAQKLEGLLKDAIAVRIKNGERIRKL